MIGVYLGLAGLGLSVLGLAVKLTKFITEIRVWVEEMRHERKVLRQVPMIDYRLRHVEKHLDLSTPSMNGT